MLRLVNGHLDALGLYTIFRKKSGQTAKQARDAAGHFFRDRPKDCPLTKIEAISSNQTGRHPIPCLHTGEQGIEELEALWCLLDFKIDGEYANAAIKVQVERLIKVTDDPIHTALRSHSLTLTADYSTTGIYNPSTDTPLLIDSSMDHSLRTRM
jgi:hypothetical protein